MSHGVSSVVAADTERLGLVAALGNASRGGWKNLRTDAVTVARSLAPHGSTVLLSPGTSSFDQFSGDEQRGNTFRDLVHQLR